MHSQSLEFVWREAFDSYRWSSYFKSPLITCNSVKYSKPIV